MKIIPFSIRAGFIACIILLLSACQTPYPKGVTPVEATWLLGYHTIPAQYTLSDTEQSWRHTLNWQVQATKELKPKSKIPVVLYLHGCAGIGHEDLLYRHLMLSHGYAVFMPDSFARNRLPCRDEGPLSVRVVMRTAEVKNALTQLKNLPWVDQTQIILMGFSEGGNAADNWSRPGFEAIIVLGSACTEGSTDKPAAPADVPVLAIVGQYDTYRPGLHCRITRIVGGSRSIVIPGARHQVASYPQTRQAIVSFLKQCCTKSQAGKGTAVEKITH